MRPAKDQQWIVEDLERKRSLLTTINDFALNLMGIPTSEELLWYVAREVVGRLEFADCVIYLVDPARGMLVQKAAIGAKNPQSNQILNALEIPIGEGITGHVARTRAPLIVDDLSDDRRYISDLEPALSEICVPLIIDDEVVGVIDSEDPRPGHFDREHLELLTTVAAMTSAKLKLINQTRRVEERTEELHRLNDQLLESEQRLRQATRLARIGYYVWDIVADRCLFCSEAHARIHGVSPAEYIACASTLDGDMSLTHPEDREAYRTAVKDLSRGKTLEMEYRVVSPAGEVRHVREIAEPIFDDAGVAIQGIGTSQDITEIKRAEAQLHHALKMEAVGQLTGGVAHDFNNLLAVIRGNAELLADRLEGESRHTRAILRASDLGAELTQRLLAFSRQQPLRAQSLDLAALVADMTELLDRTLGEAIEIEMRAQPGLWPAMADPGQVENALLNLAVNARDAMPDGGRLIIDCANARLDEAYTAQQPDAMAGDYVMLAARDSGTGMTPAVRAQAFEPFFTTKEVGKGSGLGLSMVYGFAQQSGGHVTIDSRARVGTTVKLFLPRAEQAPAAKETAEAFQVPRGDGQVVMVVEDDQNLRAVTAEVIEGLGYRVVAVSEAAEARAALEDGERVDLVLSDVMLPGGTNGPALAAEVRQSRPDIAVIFMSGYAAKHNGALGPDSVLLNKPFEQRDLAEALRAALD